MRLSSLQIFQQGISGILAGQARLNHTEQQLATGRRVLTPADDPVAAVQILDISEDLQLVDQYQRNGNLAQGQLVQEESVLTDVGNVLQRVRELVVQANNASQSPQTRESIAGEVKARIDELESLANTQDASGEYIFAGFQTGSEPFARTGSSVTYTGDDNQRFLQLGNSTGVAVRDSGFEVFVAIAAGNGTFSTEPNAANTGTGVFGSSSASSAFVLDNYDITFSQVAPAAPITFQVTDSSAGVVASGNYNAGDTIDFAGASVRIDGVPANGDSFQVTPSQKQDMFATLQNIVDDLSGTGSAPADLAAVNNAMAGALDNLDQALGKVLDVRADIGVRLNHVDNQLNLNDSFNLQLQETLSEVQDLDYAEAISRFNLELTALQAAQQAYVKAQGLSLFNFIQ